MVNKFPYTILTKRIRILPTKWKGKTPALRAEFIGCKNGCLKSLGVAQNAPSGGAAINNVANRRVENNIPIIYEFLRLTYTWQIPKILCFFPG